MCELLFSQIGERTIPDHKAMRKIQCKGFSWSIHAEKYKIAQDYKNFQTFGELPSLSLDNNNNNKCQQKCECGVRCHTRRLYKPQCCDGTETLFKTCVLQIFAHDYVCVIYTINVVIISKKYYWIFVMLNNGPIVTSHICV